MEPARTRSVPVTRVAQRAPASVAWHSVDPEEVHTEAWLESATIGPFGLGSTRMDASHWPP
jgi:hypothetical protein